MLSITFPLFQNRPVFRAATEMYCPPQLFALFMKRKDVNISGKWRGKTLAKHLMDRYDEFCGKDFLRKEEFKEKILFLCKNENYQLNKGDAHGTFLGWACDRGHIRIVQSLLTFPECNSQNLTSEQLLAFEKMTS